MCGGMFRSLKRGGMWLRVVLLIALAAARAMAADKIVTDPQGPLDVGYVDLYNLDFAGAHAQFAAWMQAHPDDPLGTASDAAAYLFGEFDRLSIIDVQLFADQSRFDSRGRLMPDPSVRKAFEARADQT